MHDDASASRLRAADAGARVIRGGAARIVAYGASVVLAGATSVVLLRYLGVARFGVFATVTAIVGVVAGVTDAGLGSVGNRELARAREPHDRLLVLRSLIALRLLLTPAGVAAAAVFAAAGGYDSLVIVGILLAGAGLVIVNVQLTLTQLLAVDLRFAALSLLDVARGALTLLGISLLAAVGAGVLPFFAVQIVVGALLLSVTPLLVRDARRAAPRWSADTRALLRLAAPLALAVAANVVYFRVLVVVTSLVGSAVAVGLYGTSFRIVELLAALPYVLLSSALPVLAVDALSDDARFRRVAARLTDTALIVGVGVALMTAALAEPVVIAIGGSEFRGAIPVLQVQALALIPLFLVTAWTLILVGLGRTRPLAIANLGALVLVVALGVPLVAADGARGAAIAAVLAEVVLALAVAVVLARHAPGILRFPERGLRILAAAAMASAVAVAIPGSTVGGVAAGTVYVVALLVLRAVPPELEEQVRLIVAGRPS